ncbi:MATE family efflux transporter [Fusibacter sp. JL298sf-3]
MEKKQFNRYLLALTLPIIIQNLITTALNLLDTMMIGRIGEVQLAAVGLANQFYFLYTLFIFGVAGGSGVLIAQLWGNKDQRSIKKVLGRSLISALLLSTVFMVVGLTFTEEIIGLFNDDPTIVAVGSSYLRITLMGYLFTSVSFVLASALRSINNTKMPMYASLLGLIINGTLNMVLIFGYMGFEPMHAKGAAIATLTARTIECFVLIYFIYKHVPELALGVGDFKGLETSMKASLKKVTYPILLNEACWGIGMVTYVGLYARLGTRATAAMQICSTVMNLFMVVAFGLSYAALVVVGNEVGAGKSEHAMELSAHIRKLALKVGVVLAAILFASSGVIPMFFKVSPEVKSMSQGILSIFALMLPLRMLNMLMIVGVLRGGGDALYGTILQATTLWIVGIPLTFVCGFVLRLPVPVVVGASFAEEVVKWLLIQRRYKSEKWVRVVFS